MLNGSNESYRHKKQNILQWSKSEGAVIEFFGHLRFSDSCPTVHVWPTLWNTIFLFLMYNQSNIQVDIYQRFDSVAP